MSIFLNRIVFIAYFVFVSNCTKEVVRVYNPITDKDKKSYGVMAFGLYAYNQNHKDLLNLFSKDSGTVFAELGMYGVKFSEIVSKDAQKNSLAVSPYPIEGPAMVEKVESTQYLEGKTGYLSPFYLLLSLDPAKEYAITGVTYTYQVNCGQKCRRVVVRDFSVEPSKSFKAFPIKTKAGDITFGGILMARVAPASKDDPYGLSDDVPGLSELFAGNKVLVNLESGEEYIKGMESSYLKKLFYGGEVNQKNAEKLFYENLIKAYPEGYWKTLAEKKRAALGN
ncbi:hypothetical protein IQB76_12845 [Leptospira borgpetersenii serovar Hardjo-bovis]|uniref:Lipoprotein n=5 Tax=Leptospira borgpetersenii TaxID=174 RepID=M6BH31_LEPBO|nr:hypothetical protein [Leptospira borgpetersenii]EMO63710.1 hypothetical protein LEP1GSC133_4601 [Leptospira borgpetersenii serovar Pomona str. 200901868]ABJ79694.1 Hypothetical lipoprotein [Leptospira borgpetersenii serovar Hardjo-bovis str. L550]AMX59061.1 hypothetical protein LBK6_12155 [Leptospira borgpetersenii serovar Hardjo]AMX62313.1 hypothetical protein LBK9_12195 [Leptospira borgpetersenii serovar Hardjo]AMX65554.1 hypothetical protein LBK30_12210 [Leptospira borgpetersenii serovar